jgi:hypothetical protein
VLATLRKQQRSEEIEIEIEDAPYFNFLVALVAFAATGMVMRTHAPRLRVLGDDVRLIYRSRHIYLMASGMANVLLGVYLVPSQSGFSRLRCCCWLLSLPRLGTDFRVPCGEARWDCLRCWAGHFYISSDRIDRSSFSKLRPVMKNVGMKHGENVVRIEAEALRALADRIAGPMAEAFQRAVELMFGCSGRVVVTGMGKSGLIARKIAATLSSTGTPALYLHPVEALHGDLGMVVRGDVVLALSASGETEEISWRCWRRLSACACR